MSNVEPTMINHALFYQMVKRCMFVTTVEKSKPTQHVYSYIKNYLYIFTPRPQ